MKSNNSKSQPLVVELHSWSNTASSQANNLSRKAKNKDWNYIMPNFRGVSNHEKACCSEFVIDDIEQKASEIDRLLDNLK